MKITTLSYIETLYTKTMKAVKATYPTKRRPQVQYAAWAAVGMITIMLLAQLFSFENFASVLMPVMSYDNQQLVEISAALVVVVELLAIPYLLGTKLSRLMRIFSATLGGLTVLFWLFTSLTNAHAENSAIFGDTFTLPGGLLAVLWSLILAGAYVYIVAHERRSTS